MNIPIAKTYLNDEEIYSVLEPLKSGWLVQGPKVREFENEWSKFTKVKNSIAVTSCTAALFLSLAAQGFGPGDEAIVPAFTWISTANVIEHLGGKVIFVDININDFNIDVSKIKELITPKTKAIIPVHLFGLSAKMDEILSIAKSHNLLVIEDAACGFGSYYKNKHVGGFGNTGCFSFHPRKSITTGEGGMVTTNDDELAERIRCFRDHGASVSDLQRHHGPKPYLLADHPYAGYNFRMTDIQAALGLTQMKRAKEIVDERNNLALNYKRNIDNLDWLKYQETPLEFNHGYQSFACLYKPQLIKKFLLSRNFKKLEELNLERNEFMDKLLKSGISTRPATHAVHMLKFYKDKYKYKEIDFPNAKIANDLSISFPLFNGLKKEEQEFIVDFLLKYKN